MSIDNAAALQTKLIKARQKYNRTRDAVLASIESRRGAIKETIVDLQDEDKALAEVAKNA